MAARINRVHLDENWRTKIQMSMLLLRLENHALGEIELSATQIKAIEVLLRKCLPDLQSVEMSGPAGGPIETRRWEVVDPADPPQAPPAT